MHELCWKADTNEATCHFFLCAFILIWCEWAWAKLEKKKPQSFPSTQVHIFRSASQPNEPKPPRWKQRHREKRCWLIAIVPPCYEASPLSAMEVKHLKSLGTSLSEDANEDGEVPLTMRAHTRALHRISLSTREGRVIDHEEERVGEQASLWCGVTDRPKARLHWYYPWFWIDRKGKGNRKREPRWKQLIREKGKGLLKRREDDRGKTFWSCFHCGKWFSTVAQRTELWKWPKTKGEGDIDDINVSLEGRRDVVEQSSNY